MSFDGGVCVIAEQKDGQLREITLELVSEGRRLSNKLGRQLTALVVGKDVGNLAQPIVELGADMVWLLDSPNLGAYCPEYYTDVLADFINVHCPRVVLTGHTAVGRDLAPRLAARLRTALVAACTAVSCDREGSLLYTKPIHDGKASCTVTGIHSEMHIVTIKPGTVDMGSSDPSRTAKIVTTAADLNGNLKTKMFGIIKADPKTVSIKEAESIVAGGGGAMGNNGWPLLEALADAMGASMAGSRVAVDAGFITSQRQVGQTGKTVKPRLYFACGISGAIQHTIGMKDSELVVAVNSDRDAPIFKVADVCIVGDIVEMVPALTRRMKQVKVEESG